MPSFSLGNHPVEKDGKGNYRELVSASNCLDFQARRMNTKAGFDSTQQVSSFIRGHELPVIALPVLLNRDQLSRLSGQEDEHQGRV